MRFFSTLAPFEQHNVLYMGGMREHIDRLDGYHAIGFVELLQVARLGGRIAADVHDPLWCSPEDGLYHIGVHTSAWRVGDDDIGI